MTADEKRKAKKNHRKAVRKAGKHLNEHHIVPSSRGGKSTSENIATVDKYYHRSYHTLFANKTPDEIIRELVTNYWNNQWDWVARAIENEEESWKEEPNYYGA